MHLIWNLNKWNHTKRSHTKNHELDHLGSVTWDKSFPLSGDWFPVSKMGWMWGVEEGWPLRPLSIYSSTLQVTWRSTRPHSPLCPVCQAWGSPLGWISSHPDPLESAAIVSQFPWMWGFYLNSNKLLASPGRQLLSSPLILLGGIHLSRLNEWCFEPCPRNVGWTIQYLSPASSLPETSPSGHPGDWVPYPPSYQQWQNHQVKLPPSTFWSCSDAPNNSCK